MTPTKICLSLTEPTLAADLALVERNRDSIDAVELRADFLDSGERSALRSFPERARLPAILTVRRESDGGRFRGSEEERVSLLRSAIEAPWAFVDLEEDLAASEVEARARARSVRIIRSLHLTAGLPPDLAGRLRRLARSADELPKAAVLLGSSRDLLSLLDAYDELSGVEKVLLGMGPYGFPTRVLASRLGSALSYCTAGERSAAPGHVDPVTLSAIYRARSIGERTELYAVIGNPVMHSRSPWIHNPGFRALGIDAVYLPLPIDDIALFFAIAERLRIRGSSVTIPHKRAVLPYLAERSPEVARIGSCNTLVRTPNGWRGANTDASGFLAPLRRAVEGTRPPRRLPAMTALVAGAGGSARAVVFALTDEGARVTVANRTVERARSLAEEFGCDWAELSSGLVGRGFDLIVQTTSVGMEGGGVDAGGAGNDPLAFYDLSGREIVYDLVYSPRETKLLRRAQAAGCRVVPGMEMLLEQAYAQFALFTGRDYPRGAAET